MMKTSDFPEINQNQNILFFGLTKNPALMDFVTTFSKLEKIHFSLAVVNLDSIGKDQILKLDFIDQLLDHKKVCQADFEFDSLPPLDEPMLLEMAAFENAFMRMCDRLYPQYKISYEARKKMYLMQVRYWNNVITSKRINLFISSNVPHEMADYVIYAICKVRGINIIIFDDINLLPDCLFLIDDIEKSCEKIHQNIETLGSNCELERFNDIFIKFRDRQDRSIINSIQSLVIKQNAKTSIIAKLIFFLEKFFWIVRHKLREFGSYDFCKYIFSGLEKKIQERKANYFYQKNSSIPDLSVKYIYWAIHYQPECSSSPMGGYFVDQILIAQMLSYCLPKDVIVYAKEHPLQVHNRSTEFYEEILKLSNIKFVKKDFSTLELIDNSMAVATMTGSAGWEALLTGKPVLKFGNSFYQYAPGVFVIKTKEQLMKALNVIVNKFIPDFNGIRLFLRACEISSVQAWTLEEHKAQLSKNSLQKNTSNLCLAIIKRINSGAY